MTIVVDSSSFPNAWAYAVKRLMDYGTNRPADDERAVIIRNDKVVIELDYAAIQDIYKHKLHPAYPQQRGLDDYIAQFDIGTAQAKDSMSSQPYTYMGRTLRQLQVIRTQHLLQKAYNKRVEFITWNPFEDLGSDNPPCFQNCNLVNIGDGRVEMFTHWRSHDIYGAWMWNIIGIVEYVTREILEPEGLRLVKYSEFNNSGHIYDYNWADARKVLPLPEVALHTIYK